MQSAADADGRPKPGDGQKYGLAGCPPGRNRDRFERREELLMTAHSPADLV
jgi:hypothetical protein